MEPVETLSLVIAVWFLGMFLTFLVMVQASRVWRMALHGHADGVALRRSWRLNILYSQYWMLVLAMSLVWLVFAEISMVIATHSSAASVESLPRLVAYIMRVFAVGTMVFGSLGVRYIRRLILRDTTPHSPPQNLPRDRS